jgi:hypothetical protein
MGQAEPTPNEEVDQAVAEHVGGWTLPRQSNARKEKERKNVE